MGDCDLAGIMLARRRKVRGGKVGVRVRGVRFRVRVRVRMTWLASCSHAA